MTVLVRLVLLISALITKTQIVGYHNTNIVGYYYTIVRKNKMNTQKTPEKIGLEIQYDRTHYSGQQIVEIIKETLGPSARVKTPIHYPISGKEVKRILKTDDPLAQYGWTVAFINGQLTLTLDFDDVCSPALEKIQEDFLNNKSVEATWDETHP